MEYIFSLAYSGWWSLEKLATNEDVSFFTQGDIEEQLKAFWEIEEPQIIARASPENACCEDHFKRSHSRTEGGPYCVELPLSDDPGSVGYNRGVASKIPRIGEKDEPIL